MDLVVEHLLVEVHRCSSFFPTRFSGWPTSLSAGMMPPYEAQGELQRITLPHTPVNSTQPLSYASFARIGREHEESRSQRVVPLRSVGRSGRDGGECPDRIALSF